MAMCFSEQAEGDWSDIRQKARNSMLFIEATRQNRDGTNREVITSTGFVVSDRGFGITVAHAVPRATSATIVTYQASVGSRHGHRFPVEVVRRNEDLDLALLTFPKVQDWRPIDVGSSKDVPEDTRLYVLGFPRSSDLASAEGLLSSHFGPGGKWQTTLPLDYGNSGGPVFDIGGRVIGVAAGGHDEARAITFVIPFDYARPLHSLVAILSTPSVSDPVASLKTFPFSVTVDHEDRKQVEQEFCVEEGRRIKSVSPEVVSQAGRDTTFISAVPVPARPNCVLLRAFVAGNGVDRIGPLIVNYRGRGWLSGQIKVDTVD
jgi:S1-C subfamily serine protease